jgi:hypothetical protein
VTPATFLAPASNQRGHRLFDHRFGDRRFVVGRAAKLRGIHS